MARHRRVKGRHASGWFAARPSGTESIYKIYAESFKGENHLAQIQSEAQTIVQAAFAAAGLHEARRTPCHLQTGKDPTSLSSLQTNNGGYHGNPRQPARPDPNFDRMCAKAQTSTTRSPASLCAAGAPVCRRGCTPPTPASSQRADAQDDAVTMAQCFNEAGYDTGYIGKWHLATQDPAPEDERGSYQYWLAANLLEFTSDVYDTVASTTTTSRLSCRLPRRCADRRRHPLHRRIRMRRSFCLSPIWSRITRTMSTTTRRRTVSRAVHR